MRFTGTCLITAHVLALADFYARVLGVQAEGDEGHAEVHTEGAGIAIMSATGMDEMAPGSMQGAGCGSTVLMFEVEDVDAEYARLCGLGVEWVMPPRTHPWGARSCWFRDPDGNIVDFYAVIKAPHPQPLSTSTSRGEPPQDGAESSSL